MNEEEAHNWLAYHGWWNGNAGDRLRAFVDLVLDEADRQNLISAATRPHIWARHVVDSAQLMINPAIAEAGASSGHWVDLGAGAGFPGMVIACLRDAPVSLIEVRPLRVEFLRRCANMLNLKHVTVVQAKVEAVRFDRPVSVISARAYAPLDRLLASAHHLGDENTLWLLPKGRNSEKELAIVRPHWQAVFHVEQSITDTESAIVTARQLRKLSAPRRQDQQPGAPKRETNRWRAVVKSGKAKGRT